MDTKTEILTEIKALSSHYPRRQLGVAEQVRWLNDYAEDLSAFSAADVRLACAQWRKSEATRMPNPGELIAKCRNLVRPEYESLPPPTPEPKFSEAHKREMLGRLAALAQELAQAKSLRNYNRLPGETPTDYARRLWPNREVKP